MSRSTVVMIAVSLSLLFASAGHAVAQQKRYYTPSRPTITPYLNYLRRSTGVLDRYNEIVAPTQQLNRQLSSQNAGLRHLGTQLQQVRQSGMTITGTGSVFMNYSHFYPVRQR